jgi:hypothetical protein
LYERLVSDFFCFSEVCNLHLACPEQTLAASGRRRAHAVNEHCVERA